MNWMKRWVRRIFIALVILALILIIPYAYVETQCRGNIQAFAPEAIVAPENRRPQSRTYTTYPEWHIVHAYDDYAEVISKGDPHEYSYVKSVISYWTTLCTLSKTVAPMGGITSETKQMLYVIGYSFSVEWMFKALYEETLGRLATLIRGPVHSPLDTISAQQACAYATFLQQVPWYKWDFDQSRRELTAAMAPVSRDRERKFALGLEYWVKAKYARVIDRAVQATGKDELWLRMVVRNLDRAILAEFDQVRIIANHGDLIEIETPRYRVLTNLLVQMAEQGADFVEIAGNREIMFTSLSPASTHAKAIYSFARQGYGDYRHLNTVQVADLAQVLREMRDGNVRLEHIHDY